MKALKIAALALFALAGAAHADPVEGLWQTQPDEGAFAHVKIVPCGAAFCGTIQRTFKDGTEYKSPNLGKQLVRSMAPKGNGKYEGQVWRPSNNKIYLGKIDLNGNSMRLSGCVAGGLICSKQTWQRVQ
jgi:uncharacterized protein (DUF2147 family)